MQMMKLSNPDQIQRQMKVKIEKETCTTRDKTEISNLKSHVLEPGEK